MRHVTSRGVAPLLNPPPCDHARSTSPNPRAKPFVPVSMKESKALKRSPKAPSWQSSSDAKERHVFPLPAPPFMRGKLPEFWQPPRSPAVLHIRVPVANSFKPSVAPVPVQEPSVEPQVEREVDTPPYTPSKPAKRYKPRHGQSIALHNNNPPVTSKLLFGETGSAEAAVLPQAAGPQYQLGTSRRSSHKRQRFAGGLALATVPQDASSKLNKFCSPSFDFQPPSTKRKATAQEQLDVASTFAMANPEPVSSREPISGRRLAFLSSPLAPSLNSMSFMPTVVRKEHYLPSGRAGQSVGSNPTSQPRVYTIPARRGCDVSPRRSAWWQRSWATPGLPPKAKRLVSPSPDSEASDQTQTSPSPTPMKSRREEDNDEVSYGDDRAELATFRTLSPSTIRRGMSQDVYRSTEQTLVFKYPVSKLSVTVPKSQDLLRAPHFDPEDGTAAGSTLSGSSPSTPSPVRAYDQSLFDDYLRKMWGESAVMSRQVSKVVSTSGQAVPTRPSEPPLHSTARGTCDLGEAPTESSELIDMAPCEPTQCPQGLSTTSTAVAHSQATRPIATNRGISDPVLDFLCGASTELQRDVEQSQDNLPSPTASLEALSQGHSPIITSQNKWRAEGSPVQLERPDPPSPIDHLHLLDLHFSTGRDYATHGGFQSAAELYVAFNGLLGHHIEMLKLLLAGRECAPLQEMYVDRSKLQLTHRLVPTLHTTALHLDSLRKTLLLTDRLRDERTRSAWAELGEETASTS